jgi:phage terminase large subunit GpA-like protein
MLASTPGTTRRSSTTGRTVNGKKLGAADKLWPVGVDIAKAELYGWLGLPWEPGTDAPPGYCHFPEYGPDFFKQLTAEHLVETTNKKTGRKQREWHVLPNRESGILARAAVSLRIDYRRPGAKSAAGSRTARRFQRCRQISWLDAVDTSLAAS